MQVIQSLSVSAAPRLFTEVSSRLFGRIFNQTVVNGGFQLKSYCHVGRNFL